MANEILYARPNAGTTQKIRNWLDRSLHIMAILLYTRVYVSPTFVSLVCAIKGDRCSEGRDGIYVKLIITLGVMATMMMPIAAYITTDAIPVLIADRHMISP
jgi:hypothetical protein